MMNILDVDELASVLDPLRKQKKSIVVAGGCFDILHIGHIRFLQASRKLGDMLMVLLESDETVKKLKGKHRPYFSQKERAEMLTALRDVDYVLTLPPNPTDQNYSEYVQLIRPSVIAVTEKDPLIVIKDKHAFSVHARIVKVPFVQAYSTSNLARLLGVE